MFRSPECRRFLFSSSLLLVGTLWPLVSEAAEPIDLRYVPDAAAAAVVLRPAELLATPGMESLPIEVVSAAGLKEIGVDPADVSQAMLIFGQPTMQGPPPVGVIVHMTKDYPGEDIGERVADLLKAPGEIDVTRPDDRTLWIGDSRWADAMEAADGSGQGALLVAMRAAKTTTHGQVFVSVEAMRPFVMQMMTMAPPLPPPLEDFKKIPGYLETIQLDVHIDEDADLVLSFDAVDEEKAVELEKLLNMALMMGRQALTAQMQQGMQQGANDPVEQAMAKYSARILDRLFVQLKPQRDGDVVAIKLENQGTIAASSVMLGMLMPAVASAQQTARSVEVANNLRYLGLTLMEIESEEGRYPAPTIADAAGKPLLSWRVAVLPYLGEQELFEQFKLDEPWDSEHNIKLLPAMPEFFRNATAPSDTKTTFQLVVGPSTVFAADKPSSSIITDGASNTVLLVETDASAAVEWTKPADWKFDPKNPSRDLGGNRPDGFWAAYADMHVSNHAKDTDASVLRALFTYAGGEIITEDGVLDGPDREAEGE